MKRLINGRKVFSNDFENAAMTICILASADSTNRETKEAAVKLAYYVFGVQKAEYLLAAPDPAEAIINELLGCVELIDTATAIESLAVADNYESVNPDMETGGQMIICGMVCCGRIIEAIRFAADCCGIIPADTASVEEE